MTRVFVTGMGAFTPIGNDVPSFWDGLLTGKSGAGPVTLFDTQDMPFNMACEVKGFDPDDHMDRKTSRRTSRSTQLAIAASRQALADADFAVTEENWYRVGVMMATGGGGITEMEHASVDVNTKGWRVAGPFIVPSVMANAASCLVSIETGARGPVMTSTAACASGHYSIIEAFHYLQRGEADVMIAGGTESALSLLIMAAFGRMGPLSKSTDDPTRACRPFSVDRDGFVSGEGACALILETEDHARKRGARIYGEVLGGALTGDAYHITAPDPTGDGAARALENAVRYAGLTPNDIGVVFAHGTGTALNDVGEAMALKRTFGEHIYDMQITSIKSMVGHALGAAGAQSAVAAVMSLRNGVVPPTINYTPDPDIDIPIVGNVAQATDAAYATVNAFGFGGQNVVAVFGKTDE